MIDDDRTLFDEDLTEVAAGDARDPLPKHTVPFPGVPPASPGRLPTPLPAASATGFFESADGRQRPGVPIGWPWPRFGPSEERLAAPDVRAAIGVEFSRVPRVVPGGRVVFASPAGEALVVVPEEVARDLGGGKRGLPVTIERSAERRPGQPEGASETWRLVKLGVYGWFAFTVQLSDRAFSAGRLGGIGWRDAVLRFARLRAKIELAGGFSAADLDWAEQHAGASVVRSYAIATLARGSTPGV